MPSKTTILRALWAAATGTWGSTDPIAAHKLPSGSVTLDFAFDGSLNKSTATFANGKPNGATPIDVDILHFDAGSSLPFAQKYFCEFENSADLINGVGPLFCPAT
jgi:hypothetical protein